MVTKQDLIDYTNSQKRNEKIEKISLIQREIIIKNLDDLNLKQLRKEIDKVAKFYQLLLELNALIIDNNFKVIYKNYYKSKVNIDFSILDRNIIVKHCYNNLEIDNCFNRECIQNLINKIFVYLTDLKKDYNNKMQFVIDDDKLDYIINNLL